jgi:hypothetical protein
MGRVAAVVFSTSLVIGFGIALMIGPQDLGGVTTQLAGAPQAPASGSVFTTPVPTDPADDPTSDSATGAAGEAVDTGGPDAEAADDQAPRELTGVDEADGPTPLYVPGDPLETEVAVLAPADTRIQVLDGRRDDGAAYAAAVARLEELGYTVLDSGHAVRPYETTTVFFTNGNEAQAEVLRDTDERFHTIEANTRGLSEAVELHIVIGTDWES